jgi:hypothetical protein
MKGLSPTGKSKKPESKPLLLFQKKEMKTEKKKLYTEREGVEPSVAFQLRRFSKPMH